MVETCGLMRASPYPTGWPLSVSCNEADSSSRDTTARALIGSGFDGQNCFHPPPTRLHGFRPFTMIDTLQLTRVAKLCLAHRKTRKAEVTSDGWMV